MSKAITLLDEVQMLAFKNPQSFTPEFRRQLQAARSFVLDDGMSAALADIGHAAYLDKARQPTVMEEIRHLARLPHAVTWIEWNEKPLARRASAIYGSAMKEDLVPEKTGWLMMQHPTIETAFQAVSFGVGITNFGSEGMREVGLTPFAVTWRSDDDGPIPWHPHPLTLDRNGALVDRGMAISGIMTGLPSYRSPMIGLKDCKEFYNLRPSAAVEFRNMLGEQMGMMRYVLGFLATINDLPIGITKTVASKGFMAKGNYRKFLSHNIITLKVPADQYRNVAKKAIMGMQRRAHQVRGHWRVNWRKPDHKIWIHEHQRGDASRGFVTHDYEVKHK